jgi:hypothetical protein
MKRYLFAFLAGIAFFSIALPAQEPLRAPDGGTTFHVSGVELLPLPGMPLTGKSNVQWTRTLEDGSTVTVKEQANLARDSQGRMYRERRAFEPADSDRPSPLMELQFFDPTARTRTICTVATRQCVISDYHPSRQFALLPPGPYANGTRNLNREDLGANVIDGVNVTGTRETTTINPGVVGNDRALVSTREFWYSAQLQTNLLVTRIDPREGKQVIRLIGFSQSEPDPHTFDIPEGYAIHDQRAAVTARREN